MGAASSGSGGDISIRATERITLSGQDSSLSASTLASGAAGNITLDGGTVQLTNRGAIVAATSGEGRAGVIAMSVERLILEGRAQIEGRSTGAGDGGAITITATETLTLSGVDTGLFTTSEGAGRGGEISLAGNRVQLESQAVISAASTGANNAGSVRVTAGDFRSADSTLTTLATQADGGDLSLTARSLVFLRDSTLTAVALGGAETVGGIIGIQCLCFVGKNAIGFL